MSYYFYSQGWKKIDLKTPFSAKYKGGDIYPSGCDYIGTTTPFGDAYIDTGYYYNINRIYAVQAPILLGFCFCANYTSSNHTFAITSLVFDDKFYSGGSVQFDIYYKKDSSTPSPLRVSFNYSGILDATDDGMSDPKIFSDVVTSSIYYSYKGQYTGSYTKESGRIFCPLQGSALPKADFEVPTGTSSSQPSNAAQLYISNISVTCTNYGVTLNPNRTETLYLWRVGNTYYMRRSSSQSVQSVTVTSQGTGTYFVPLL